MLKRIRLADGTKRQVRPQEVAGALGIGGQSDALNPGRLALPRERISRYADGEGRVMWRRYKANAMLTEEVDSLGRVTKYERDRNRRPLKVTRPNGTVVESSYDAMHGHLLSRREKENGATKSYRYDRYGLPTGYTDARGNSTSLERDANGNVVKITNARGHATSIEYDATGLPLKLTDANGRILRSCYNARGLPERITEEGSQAEGTVPTCMEEENRAGVRVRHYEYDVAGRPTRTESPAGVVLRYTYDGRNRLTSVTDQEGQELRITYDR